MDVELDSCREERGSLGGTLTVDNAEISIGDIDQKPPFSDQKSRSKTSLRIRYEAEVEVIRRKLGSLESIREQLGLSQRKVCQLLLVDPSAWSRWVRADEDAPPHIYRMLQWYLALQDKYPALDVNFWLSTVTRAQEPLRNEIREAQLAQIPGKVDALSAQIHDLQSVTRRQKRLIVRLMILSVLSAALAAGLLVALVARG